MPRSGVHSEIGDLLKERTLTILKPDCVKKRCYGEIIHRILQAGFDIVAMKMVEMDGESASDFYHVHKGKPFFDILLDFMTSGPVIVMVLEKENAIEDFRDFIGSTNPEEAAIGTIRHTFAESAERNIIHGSDSPAHAMEEIAHFFNNGDFCRI